MARPRNPENAHLPRNVHQRHGAFFLVLPNGKWTKLAHNIADALIAMGQRMKDADPNAPKALSVADLIATALPFITKNVSDSTREKYRFTAKQLCDVFPNTPATALKPKHLFTMRQELSDQPSKFNGLMTVMRLTMQYAVEQDIIETNPCTDVKPLPYNKRDRYITDEQYAAIYRHADERTKIIMDLCYYTGQRITDILTITNGQLLDAGIEFCQHKTKARVLVSWSPELRDAVARAKALAGNVVSIDPAAFLLAGRGGVAVCYDTAHTHWSKAVKASGVKDVHIHDLRAKAASDCENQHGEQGEQKAQGLMGHGSANMTRRYLRNRRAKVAHGPTKAAA